MQTAPTAASRVNYVRPTARQRQVLAALVEAGSLDAAALQLGVDVNTISTHIHRIRNRCGLSREQAIYFGVRDGWLSVRISARELS